LKTQAAFTTVQRRRRRDARRQTHQLLFLKLKFRSFGKNPYSSFKFKRARGKDDDAHFLQLKWRLKHSHDDTRHIH
jgi:hypothetical protein